MATIKTVLHSKLDKKGRKKYRLAIRLTANRKSSYYSLGHNINPIYWDAFGEKIKKTHPKYKQLNRLIRKKYDQVEDTIFELESLNKKYSAKQVLDSLRNYRKGETFFDLADDHIHDLLKSGKHNRAISDKSKINRIKEFTNNQNLGFEDITQNTLKKLKIYLISKRQLSERSVMNIYVLIRLLFNDAIRKNIIDQKFYPFGKEKIKIKYPQTLKIGLNENEITKIEKLDLEYGTTIWHSRNVFLFSFYLAGVRISDVLRMRWSDIIADRLYYKMNKNNKVDSLKIPERVIEILNYYIKDKRSSTDFIFPELKKINSRDSKATYSRIKTSIKKFNKNLSEIALLAEIDKKITNHIARHSFGNIAGEKVSPQMLQKLYRHTHLSTTIGYQGNFIHKNTDEALDAVIAFSK